MGSSNKKFLAPAAVSAGEFAGNVYRLTEEFRQGKGEKKKKKGTNHTRAPRHSPAVSKCKIKKKKKKQFPNCSGTPTPSPGKKKKWGESAWSSQFQPAKVSRLIAILGLRKLLKRALIASNVQQKWGVRVSVSLRAWLALSRARSLRLPPSLFQQSGSCRSIRLPLSPLLAFIAFFLSFPTWRGPGYGARVDRTPGSAPPYSFAPEAAAARS